MHHVSMCVCVLASACLLMRVDTKICTQEATASLLAILLYPFAYTVYTPYTHGHMQSQHSCLMLWVVRMRRPVASSSSSSSSCCTL